MNRTILPTCQLAIIVAAMLALSVEARAQTKEAQPEALKAFEEVIKAWRDFPALGVKSTIKIEMMEGDVAASSEELQAEFVFGPNRCAVVRLRGFTVYLHTEPGADAGLVAAIHESQANNYFTSTDDGSPYYALLNSFVDLPFPELAIMLGFDATEDVLMQLHPKEPWLQPTSVTIEQVDGKEVQRLTLEADFSKMTLLLDPKTKLIQTATLEISGGELVRDGATLVYRYAWEYELHEKPLNASTFKLDPAQRQKVDLMAALLPRPQPMDDDMEAGGEDAAIGAFVGKPAPPITLAMADGKAFDLADMKGRVVVLDFWASWCGPCMMALPKLHEVAKWVSEEQMPVTIMTVNCWEIRSKDTDKPDARLASARRTWEEKGFTLPIAMDYSDETAEAYRVRGIPTTVIIRSDGIVHAQHEGTVDAETLKKDIDAALKAVEPGM